MPPHNLARIIPQRVLADVLRDATEARRALTDSLQSSDADAEDRATEAEQRLDNLRDEFDAKFQALTGLAFGDVQHAVNEAVL